MVQDLILTLKADNVEACFILPAISFHSLSPKISVAKYCKFFKWTETDVLLQ